MGIYIGKTTFNEMLSMSGEQLYDLIRSYDTVIEEVFEPHGKLIDADKLTKAICEYEYADTTSTEESIGANHCRELIDKSFPVIDESEECENTMIELFVDQVGVDKSKLEYLAGWVCEHNGNFMIGFEMMGARETFSVGQPVYDREGNLIGCLGIGLYDALDYTTNKNTKIPVYYWQICLPTKHCVVGKDVYTYWQNEERNKQ